MLRGTFRSPIIPLAVASGPSHWRAADKTCSVSRKASPCQNDYGSLPVSTTGGRSAGPFQPLLRQFYNCLAGCRMGGNCTPLDPHCKSTGLPTPLGSPNHAQDRLDRITTGRRAGHHRTSVPGRMGRPERRNGRPCQDSGCLRTTVRTEGPPTAQCAYHYRPAVSVTIRSAAHRFGDRLPPADRTARPETGSPAHGRIQRAWL